jgi:hypothetical protein
LGNFYKLQGKLDDAEKMYQRAAACLRLSFTEIQLALVVGICGGAQHDEA